MPFYIAWNALNHFLGEERHQRYFFPSGGEPERVEEPPPSKTPVQKVFQSEDSRHSSSWKARVSWIQALCKQSSGWSTTKPENFGIGHVMRMRANLQSSMRASVSMSDWICTEGHNLHTGHSSQTHSSNEGTHSECPPMIPQQSCSHGCCSSHSSAVPQPCISKTATPICSFSCSALGNNLVFFQIPVNSLPRWLPVQTWILQLWPLKECSSGDTEAFIWSSNTSLAPQPPNSPRNWRHCVYRPISIKQELIKLHQWHISSRITNPTPGLQHGFNWGQHSDGSWQHPSLHEAWHKTAKPNVC